MQKETQKIWGMDPFQFTIIGLSLINLAVLIAMLVVVLLLYSDLWSGVRHLPDDFRLGMKTLPGVLLPSVKDLPENFWPTMKTLPGDFLPTMKALPGYLKSGMKALIEDVKSVFNQSSPRNGESGGDGNAVRSRVGLTGSAGVPPAFAAPPP